ncbi:hypothetical protein OXPF_41920 [Oxobacter pfennigii]|uniref:Uncharacterized protein n=1 Tax=Oxobacter pfennigii TaxID=36849 RepID=A0A0P8W447_9CLOT|nr:hypothetical protein [Oxobacter pfennigii]KPU42407.1 hypothetical protein OXPF_41920 [Oxobacter pfennigii]
MSPKNDKEPKMSLLEFLMSEEIRGKVILAFVGIGVATVGGFLSNTNRTLSMIIMFIGCALTVAAVEQITKEMPKIW